MRILCGLFIHVCLIQIVYAKIFHGCRFFRPFYHTHTTIFDLDNNQTSLSVRPLYSLSNQSRSMLSIGIIYHQADTYLVPVPLLIQCPQTEHIYTPIHCEFTITGIRSNASMRTSESTRITTVPLYFKEYSSNNLTSMRGAYFKQSTVTLRQCRLDAIDNIYTSDMFQIQIEFEQIINSSCQQSCTHSELYECSRLSNTCQCRSNRNGIEQFDQFCIDTELGSNCSLTPERCRRICRISDQIHADTIDTYCQCPSGSRRIFSNNMYHCELPVIVECMNEQSIETCPKGYICKQKRCMPTSALVRANESFLWLLFALIGLLVGASLIIIILIISLIKMRSIKCIKFIHPSMVSIHSNSWSSLNSRNNIYEKYTKIDLFE